MEMSKEVIKKGYELCTIKQFRTKHAGNVSPQAIDYAIDNDLVDHLYIGPRVRVIVMTEKTKKYTPNYSAKRKKVTHNSTMNLG